MCRTCNYLLSTQTTNDDASDADNSSQCALRTLPRARTPPLLPENSMAKKAMTRANCECANLFSETGKVYRFPQFARHQYYGAAKRETPRQPSFIGV